MKNFLYFCTAGRPRFTSSSLGTDIYLCFKASLLMRRSHLAVQSVFALLVLSLAIPQVAHAQWDSPEAACRIDRIKVKDVQVIQTAKAFDANGKVLLATLTRSADLIERAWGQNPEKGVGAVLNPDLVLDGGQRVFAIAQSTEDGQPQYDFDELPQAIGDVYAQSELYDLEDTLNDLIELIFYERRDQDDLVISIGGVKVLPTPNATYGNYRPGADDDFGFNSDKLHNLYDNDIPWVSFIDSTFVQFWENDDGPNDNLGKLDISWEGDTSTGDLRPPGVFDTGDNVRVLVGPESEGSVYEFTYALQLGGGSIDDIPERLFCSGSGCYEGRPKQPNFGSLEGGPLGACPTNYINRGDYVIGDEGGFTWCQLSLPCGDRFDDLELIGGVSALRDGDIVAIQSNRILSPEGVRPFMARDGLGLLSSTFCVPGEFCVFDDNVIASVIDPSREQAQWRVGKKSDGTFTFSALQTGKLLAVPESLFPFGVAAELNGSASDDEARWFIEQGVEGYTLRNKNNSFLYPCLDCDAEEGRPGHRLLVSGSQFSGTDQWGWNILVLDGIRRITTDTEIASFASGNLTRLIIEPGVTYTINGNVSIGQDVDIDNNGTLIINGDLIINGLLANLSSGQIIVNGSLITSDTVTNHGVFKNNGIVRGLGTEAEVLNKPSGVIVHLGRTFFADVQNEGVIYASAANFRSGGQIRPLAGSNPIEFSVLYLGAPFAASCQWLGTWAEESSTCTTGGFWLEDGRKLVVEAGLTLKTGRAAFVNEGEIANFGVIDNSDGGFFNCASGSVTGNPSTNTPEPCVTTEEQGLCETYGGTWYPGPGTPACTGNVRVTGEFRIRPGELNWDLNSIALGCYQVEYDFDADISLTLPCPEGVGNPLLIIEPGASLTVNRLSFYRGPGRVLNYGTVRFGGGPYIEDGASQLGLGLIGSGRVDNYGTFDRSIAVGYEEGEAGGTFYNHCDASFVMLGDQYDYFRGGDIWGLEQVQSLCPGVDTDGDGVDDLLDLYPYDPLESIDSDYDGVGDNSDRFPTSAFEVSDRDNDGVGDNSDAFPDDPLESIDSDGDEVGDNKDVFPNDASEWLDYDGDGTGNNFDAFPGAVTQDSSGDVVVNALLSTLDSTCSLTEVSAEGVRALPPVGMLALAPQVSFSLRGCASNVPEVLRILIDLGEPQPEGAVAYKLSATGDWTPVPGAIIEGSILSYTVVDNGPLDTNDTMGEIDDPVTVLSPAAASTETTPTAIPVMSLWTLVLLVGSLSLVAARRIRY